MRDIELEMKIQKSLNEVIMYGSLVMFMVLIKH